MENLEDKNKEKKTPLTSPKNGFDTKEEASDYVKQEKAWWGSNLVGWVEETEGRWFPCFNVWD